MYYVTKDNFYYQVHSVQERYSHSYMWGSHIYWHVEQLHHRFISHHNFFLKYPNQAMSVLSDM
jgi:hypothetical protein